jgi:hypothetical protein
MGSFLSGIAPELDLTAVTQQLVASLSDDQLNWQPAEGKWSIAQNIEHLAVINRLYTGAMAAALASVASRNAKILCRAAGFPAGWHGRWNRRSGSDIVHPKAVSLPPESTSRI